MKFFVSLIALASFSLQVTSQQSVDTSRNPGLNQSAPSAPQLHSRGSDDSRLQSHTGLEGQQPKLITIDVVVTNRSGNPFPGLSAGDFRLFDNKKEVKIERFRALSNELDGNDHAAQIMLVIDAINTSHESLARIYSQVRDFLNLNNGHLTQPISILVLSDTETGTKNGQGAKQSSENTTLANRQAFFRRIPASKDGLTLIAALNQSIPQMSRISEAQGGEGDSEKVMLSVKALDAIATVETKFEGRKIVIWISPGWSPLARSTKTDVALFNNIVYFSNLLRDARITLDFVNPDGVSGGASAPSNQTLPQNASESAFQNHTASVPTGQVGQNWYEAYYRSVKKEGQADINDLALQVLAYQSGGLVLDKNNQIENQIVRCVNEAGPSYELSFEPSSVSGAPYHELEVKVQKGNVSTRVRRGYYWN